MEGNEKVTLSFIDFWKAISVFFVFLLSYARNTFTKKIRFKVERSFVPEKVEEKGYFEKNFIALKLTNNSNESNFVALNRMDCPRMYSKLNVIVIGLVYRLNLDTASK